MKTSLSYKASNALFKFVNYKKPAKNEETFKKYLEKKRLTNLSYRPLLPAISKIKFVRKRIGNMDYYDINETGTKPILFIPGGAYIDSPAEIHWLFAERLALECNARIYVPLYPKLPDNNYLDCYKALNYMLDIIPKESILLCDSAGGGLGLGLLMSHNKGTFSKTILISPWVDVRMNNKDMVELEKVDPVLSIQTLKRLGEMWSLGIDSYLTSPIIGDFSKLDNIYVFSGTHEIFLPDIRLFVNKCTKAYYFEAPEMNHGFVLHPIKEAKEAALKVISIINGEN